MQGNSKRNGCWKSSAILPCKKDEVAERLRRWTANPLCSARMGSNPILVDFSSILCDVRGGSSDGPLRVFRPAGFPGQNRLAKFKKLSGKVSFPLGPLIFISNLFDPGKG